MSDLKLIGLPLEVRGAGTSGGVLVERKLITQSVFDQIRDQITVGP
jgi:hypothetical protein